MINRLIKYHTENRTLENHINNVIQNYLSKNNENVNINSSSNAYRYTSKQKKKNMKTTVISTDESYPENATALQISTVNIDFSRFEQTEEKYIDNVYHIYKQFEKDKKDDSKQAHNLDPNIKNKCIESSKIASFMVIQLHTDLGFDLYSCLNELNNTLLSKLAYQMYNMLYPSYIWPQIKYTKGCVKCDDILYLNLSKPIKKLTETFMIDVFQCDENFEKNYLNLPTRRIFNVNISDTFEDLAQQISHIYKLPPDFMLFYSQTSSAFLREFKKSMNIIQYAQNSQVINCYIVKDYNLEYCPAIIKKENIKLLQIQMRHIHQTSNNNKYCFGMPFVMSISSKQSCFDVYCMVYNTLHSIVGNRYLSSPHILKKKKVIISDNRNKFGKFDEWYWAFDKTEHSFHVRQWKRLLKYSTFELLLLPNRYYRFQDPTSVPWPSKIPEDEKTNFYEHCVGDDDDGKINEICIAIKWTDSYSHRTNELKRFKKSVNTIYIGEQYSEWKNEKEGLKSTVQSNIKYTLYDYIENHRVNYNKLNFNKIFKEKRCDLHKDLNENMKTFSFSPYPEIVSFRLQFSSNECIDYPIESSLNLLKYNNKKQIFKSNSLLLSAFIRKIQNDLDYSFYTRNLDYNFIISLCVRYCDPYFTSTLYNLYAVIYPNYKTDMNRDYGVFLKIYDQWFSFTEFNVKPVKSSDLLFAGTPLVLFYQQTDANEKDEKYSR